MLRFEIPRKHSSITKKVSLEQIANVCKLLVALTIFHLGSLGYGVSLLNSTTDPVAESKAINGMVLYYFGGSILIVGGFLLASPREREQEEQKAIS